MNNELSIEVSLVDNVTDAICLIDDANSQPVLVSLGFSLEKPRLVINDRVCLLYSPGILSPVKNLHNLASEYGIR